MNQNVEKKKKRLHIKNKIKLIYNENVWKFMLCCLLFHREGERETTFAVKN